MKTWNIRDYGACFSDRLQTEKIQKAIDDCFLAGGGRVVVPCGVYMTGGIRLRSRVELYLESGAILRGSRDPEDYFGYVNDKLEPVTIEPIGNTPKTGPRLGSRRATVTSLPIRDRPSASPIVVVVLPSPAGVGVIAVTRISFPGFRSVSSIRAGSILAL